MISETIANNILNSFFARTGSISAPGESCYIGLSTTDPGEDGSNFTEPSTEAGYKRSLLGVRNNAQTIIMSPADNRSIENSDIVFFPEATTSWGTITHFGLFTNVSADTAPTPFFWGAVAEAKEVPAEYILIFRKGALKVTLE